LCLPCKDDPVLNIACDKQRMEPLCSSGCSI
jgi:hypothetical protein